MALNVSFEFYFQLFFLIVIGVFFCFFFIHNRKELQFYRYLIIAAFLGVATSVTSFLSTAFHQYLLTRISLLLLPLIFYFLYFHYEAISHTKLSFWRYSLFFGFLIIILTLIIINSFAFYAGLNLIINFTWFLGSLFSFLCLSFSFIVVLHTYKLSKDKATYIEVLAIFMLLIPCILVTFQYSLVLLNIIALEATSRIVILASMVLIMASLITILTNFMIYKDYFYRLPFPIHQIMVINKGGILAYIRRVSPSFFEDFSEAKELIMSGFIKALTTIITEVLGTKSHLKYLDTGGYQIYFTQIPENSGIIVIITSGGSSILQKSLDRFANSISTELLNEIHKPEVYSENIQNQIDDLVSQAFPYLKIIKNV
ncbi:MAG: hypothetical protein ACFFAH_02580 [Promethearchaeota archaeon]